MRRSQCTESAAVREALDHHLNGTSDFALVLRRLDRLSRAQERLQRDHDMLSLAFGLFLRLWLANTPRLPRETRGAALADGEARYKQFLDRLADRFSSGKRFIDDLPQERMADDDELAAAAENAAEATPSGTDPTRDGSPPRT